MTKELQKALIAQAEKIATQSMSTEQADRFLKGVDWYLQHLWHDASEKPVEGTMVIVELKECLRQYEIITYINKSEWKFEWENVVRWCDLVDILPCEDQCENTKEETDILAVDLGLPSGTKWADRNLCAEAPEASGAFFRWGEVEPYTPLSPAYEFQNICMDICGTKYDAATVMLGERWRMPTKEQVDELVEECTWEWVTMKEAEGMKVTGKNGNHIFFPATGYNYLKDAALWRKGHSGRCWSGTPSTKYNAYLLGFRPVSWSCRNNLRSFGYCIRPVTR